MVSPDLSEITYLFLVSKPVKISPHSFFWLINKLFRDFSFSIFLGVVYGIVPFAIT
jgi:hypothetical protein